MLLGGSHLARAIAWEISLGWVVNKRGFVTGNENFSSVTRPSFAKNVSLQCLFLSSPMLVLIRYISILSVLNQWSGKTAENTMIFCYTFFSMTGFPDDIHSDTHNRSWELPQKCEMGETLYKNFPHAVQLR